MNEKHKSPLVSTAKALAVLLFKLTGVAIAFVCRIVAHMLNKISELLEKATGNGSNH